MNIVFNKHTPMEEVYTEQQINAMNKSELKILKAKCQSAMSEVSLKRSRYINENTEDKNSHAFYTKMNTYKTVIAIYQKAILYLTKIEKDKEPPVEQKDREHWLWCYYQESLVMLSKDTTNMLKQFADARSGFHIEFEQVFKERGLL